MKSNEVYVKTKSPPASLQPGPLKDTTVKRPIIALLFSVFRFFVLVHHDL